MGGVGSKPETLPPIAYDKDGKQLGRCSVVMCALCFTGGTRPPDGQKAFRCMR
jgi:hypothetical protein